MAIINHSFNFVFVHVPKSAGTSIVSSLSSLTRYCDVEVGGAVMSRFTTEYYSKRFRLSKHSRAVDVRNIIGDERWNSMYSFGFVRNPVDRLVSSYHFLKYKFRNWKGSEVMDGIDSLDAFVDSELFASHGPDRILRPQVFWLCGPPGRRPVVTSFGRVERIGEDLERILDEIAVPAAERAKMPALAVKNRSPREEGAAQPSAHVLDVVRKAYADDFRVFGYEL